MEEILNVHKFSDYQVEELGKFYHGELVGYATKIDSIHFHNGTIRVFYFEWGTRESRFWYPDKKYATLKIKDIPHESV